MNSHQGFFNAVSSETCFFPTINLVECKTVLYRYIAYPELYSEPPGAQLGMRYEIGPIRLAGGQ